MQFALKTARPLSYADPTLAKTLVRNQQLGAETMTRRPGHVDRLEQAHHAKRVNRSEVLLGSVCLQRGWVASDGCEQ